MERWQDQAINGSLIDAIKTYRAEKSCGLKEAKDFVESWVASQKPMPQNESEIINEWNANMGNERIDISDLNNKRVTVRVINSKTGPMRIEFVLGRVVVGQCAADDFFDGYGNRFNYDNIPMEG